jgi:hypothetical protein
MITGFPWLHSCHDFYRAWFLSDVTTGVFMVNDVAVVMIELGV